jgi:hypothetical protein
VAADASDSADDVVAVDANLPPMEGTLDEYKACTPRADLEQLHKAMEKEKERGRSYSGGRWFLWVGCRNPGKTLPMRPIIFAAVI